MTYAGRDISLHTEELHGWTLVYGSATDAQGAYLFHAVTIEQGGIARARLTIVRPQLEQSRVLEVLRARALDWMAAYNRREHSGDTDFAAL
jgi:hypothetical protein